MRTAFATITLNVHRFIEKSHLHREILDNLQNSEANKENGGENLG